jgi:hypothetical protein
LATSRGLVPSEGCIDRAAGSASPRWLQKPPSRFHQGGVELPSCRWRELAQKSPECRGCQHGAPQSVAAKRAVAPIGRQRCPRLRQVKLAAAL